MSFKVTTTTLLKLVKALETYENASKNSSELPVNKLKSLKKLRLDVISEYDLKTFI